MSSILETFAILFQTNTAEVTAAQGAATLAAEKTAVAIAKTGDEGEKAGVKMGEGAKIFGLEVKEADAIFRRFGVDFIRQVAEMATGLFGLLAVEKLVDGFFETSEMVEQLGDTSKALGVNVADLDAWDRAVVRSGGNAQEFQAGIDHLQKSLAGVSIGAGVAGAKKVFESLGISATDAQGKIKPVFDLLPELADKLSKMSNAAATGIGLKLGLDEHTILMLHEGRQAVDDMIAHEKSLGVVTQENVEAAEKWNEAYSDLKDVMRGGVLEALDDIMPILTDIVEGLTATVEFLQEHKPLIEGFFIGLAAIITTVYGPAMLVAAADTIAAVFPILAVVAVIGLLASAFALAYDDVVNFVNGNNSMLGVWITAWLGPKGPQAIREILSGIKNDFISFGHDVEQTIETLIGVWEKFIHALSDIEKLPGNLLKKLGLGSEAPEVLQPGAGAPGSANAPGVPLPRELVQAPAAPHSIHWLEEHPDSPEARARLKEAVGAGQAALAATNTPLASVGSGAMAAHQGATVSQTNTVNAEVTVNTQATDPKAVAAVVNSTLSDHISHAINHYADGVQQ